MMKMRTAIHILMTIALAVLFNSVALAQKNVGIGGCGTGQDNCHVSEYKKYKSDPHNGTLTKLGDEEDKAKEYGQKTGVADIYKAGTSCMKCHSTVAAGQSSGEDGVTCEGCHGPGSNYKEPHQEGKGGRASRPGYVKALKLGLRDLMNLDTRAKQCVSCHSITDQKLLAAGHGDGSRFNYISGLRKVANHWKRPIADTDLSKATFERAKGAKGPSTQIAKTDPPAPTPAAKQAADDTPSSTPSTRSRTPRPARSAPPAPPPPAAMQAEPFPETGEMTDPAFETGLNLPPFPQISDSISIDKQLILIKRRLRLLYQSTR
jgi:hypothetical protein